jgi:hypothetical protein
LSQCSPVRLLSFLRNRTGERVGGDDTAVVSSPMQTNRWWDAGRAPAGIYGTIISASVLAAAYEDTALEIALGVFFTLLVYWLAERWSELVGSHLRGEPFDWAHARRVFMHGWPMVQASYVPMLALIIARLLGASVDAAVNFALLTTILVLIGLGALAARRAGLPPVGLVASAIFNGLLGAVLILLKSLLH